MLTRLAAVSLLLVLTACPDTSKCKVDADCAKKGFACCDTTCVDVQNDRNNCGACGVACVVPNATTSCRVGSCQFQCQPGWGNCNDTRDDGCELDISSSAENCGFCGRTCTATNASAVCSASICGVGTCATGYANCDADSTNGCETDTRVDPKHCNGCGQACALFQASSTCAASTCEVTGCDGGWGNCDGQSANGCEVSLPNDALHCGACGKACGPGQRCGESRCRADELILFGGALGFTASTVTNEVSKFDLLTNTFTTLTPATPNGNVSPRRGHVAVWDEPRNRMVMWGGIDGAGTLSSTDTWALDFAVVPPAWRKLTTTGTPPSARFGMATALDAQTSTWYLFGGSTDTGLGLSELYTLNLETLAWTQVHGRNAANAPTDRISAAGAFDPVAKKFLLAGGSDVGVRLDLRELWSFDVTTRTWSGPVTSGPVARGRAAFFSGHPAFLFGGVASILTPPVSTLSDLSSLDVSANPPWTALTASGPAARFLAGHVARDGKLYVFGGGASDVNGQTALSDLWRFDPDTSQWTRLHDGTGTVPLGKLGPSMVGR